MSAMLEELHVAGLGVIDEVTLEFAPGLNVLTGETGAGKTMVTVALSLALGGRGSAELVRQGRDAATVEARFTDPPPALAEWIDQGELFLGRVLRPDGRSSCRVSGRLSPVSALAAAGGALVEIHGQQQAEPLLRPAAQLGFLDRFAGPGHLATLERFSAVHGEARRSRARLEALDLAVREREREKDLLTYQTGEIEAAAIVPGERAALEEERTRLTHADRIVELATGARAAVTGDGAAADALRDAAARLGTVAGIDARAADLARRASGLVAEAEDLAGELRDYLDGVPLDPHRLHAVGERLDALSQLERKYGDGEEGILAYLDDARARLTALQGQDDERQGLAEALQQLVAEERDLAGELSTGRDRAAEPLALAIRAELQDLGMAGACFDIVLQPAPGLTQDGAETVEFRFAGGPEQPVLPFSRVASGGELSRTMLACRSVLADLDDVPTLVFDEVDAGIGGRAAAAVGERLARLAEHRQVLVVTHLAQIAAHAHRHFVVTKEAGVTRVDAVQGEDRTRELARMLSGTVSGASVMHARELLGERAEVVGRGAARR
jgi:DNA repair protein RecN (Recombination protein N)